MLKSFGADDAVILASTVCLPLRHLNPRAFKADNLPRSAASSTTALPLSVRANPPPSPPPQFALPSLQLTRILKIETRWGLGLPLVDRPRANASDYAKVNFAGRPFYMLGILGFKVSLCLAYLRLLSSQRAYRRITWAVLIACTLTHLGGILVLMFQCKPVSKRNIPRCLIAALSGADAWGWGWWQVQKSWSPLTPGKCLRNDITFYILAGRVSNGLHICYLAIDFRGNKQQTLSSSTSVSLSCPFRCS